MLLELRVENLVLIERAELRLAPGLNAITGETGAGKTVLAQALDLLLGGRPRPGTVRPGASEAYVEGVLALPPGLFDEPELAELGERLPEGEDTVTLARRVGAEGRTRAFVAGRSASAADLRELGSRLVSFWGQHEHRKLVLSSAQLEALDGFCGERHLAARAAFAACHARTRELRRQLGELRERAGARDRDLDLLRFEIEEIEALDPSLEEEQRLREGRERLRHLEQLRAAAGAAAEGLAPSAAGVPGVAESLAHGERLAEGVRGVDVTLDGLVERLRALRIEAEDLAAELRRYESGLEGDPAALEEVEERLAAYDRLKRKHGGSVEAVLEHAERCRLERDRLQNAEVAMEAAGAALAEAEAEERERASALTAARRAAGPRLSKRVRSELSQLALADASFEVTVSPRSESGQSGADRVEFLIAPNPGVPAAPLRETASGGELSRVMLALMTVTSAGGRQALVFDEVDAGIGGQTARAVGERLRGLADSRQVICITHLPQIASLAERHFRIDKAAVGSVTRTTVEQLEDARVVEELCRMLGSDGSDTGARRHAEELLAAA